MDKTQRVRAAAAAAVCVIAAVSAACAGDSAPSADTSGAQLHATEKEFSISLDTHTVHAGDIKVTVTNHGALTHEFVAFGTKLADDRLPLKDGDVDENGAGVTHF
ncbi:MAG TPA: hypothetical protein VHD87_04150, partial [Acidimicrobiales bacterium]|nr:hypothetical protein [Acidimicrobiales bacterium]